MKNLNNDRESAKHWGVEDEFFPEEDLNEEYDAIDREEHDDYRKEAERYNQ